MLFEKPNHQQNQLGLLLLFFAFLSCFVSDQRHQGDDVMSDLNRVGGSKGWIDKISQLGHGVPIGGAPY